MKVPGTTSFLIPVLLRFSATFLAFFADQSADVAADQPGDRPHQDGGLRLHQVECAGEDGPDDVAAAADDRVLRWQACLLRLSNRVALPCLAGHGGGCWPRWKARSLAIARSTSMAPLDRLAVGTFANRSPSHQDGLWP